ncbi:hypothetical protein B005_4333 [Nocardiopsis alba ATCC BAA-2165]|uniref:Uncharacterized protein n=1 Tax=Nocardiopsis alba (strain ATCC BAA-2165 / BE74) TaxID=1205910 RepID=J7LE98_NOCAA|nr:hypothetical protein B005_4333 [Nocardiopsis alba ATCC BAA-2165]
MFHGLRIFVTVVEEVTRSFRPRVGRERDPITGVGAPAVGPPRHHP